MKYLIPLFDCVLVGSKKYNLKKYAKYEIKNFDEELIVFGLDKTIPYIFDDNISSSNYIKLKLHQDEYYFLFKLNYEHIFSTSFNFKNKKIKLSLSNKLFLSIDSVLKCEQDVENLKFSHYEIQGDLCLIYIVGNRNFLIVIKNEDVEFCSYYDECNENGNEKYFMCKMCDSLNHGKVCRIKDKEIETYLVYLDDEELKLKNEFVPHVFLDCLVSENLKYCNQLLCYDLKVKDAKSIKEFFPKFDMFYPLKENIFMIANKKTLAGIFEFVVENNEIVNIIDRQSSCEDIQKSL